MKSEAIEVTEALVRTARKQARECVNVQGYSQNERGSGSRYNLAYWNMFRGILWVAVGGNEEAYCRGVGVSCELDEQDCEAADWRNYE